MTGEYQDARDAVDSELEYLETRRKQLLAVRDGLDALLEADAVLKTKPPAAPAGPVEAPEPAPPPTSGEPISSVEEQSMAQRLMSIMKLGYPYRVRELAEKMSVPLESVRLALERLRDAGQVVLTGKTAGARWTRPKEAG